MPVCRTAFIFAILLIPSVFGANFQSALTKVSDEIIFTDVDSDGDPDVLERWWNGKRCRWIDENDDMLASDLCGDIVSDCLQIDMDGNGQYDSHEDLSVKWVDNDSDGIADAQVIVINPKAGEEKKFGGAAHYMVFEDTDKDGVMAYFDWSRFDFLCWRNTGRCNFLPDYNGDSIFLKIHMAPFGIPDARFSWENPFAFYDTDDDGCTEMAVRYIDDPMCDGKLDSVYISYDIDNDSQRDNEFDYDFSLRFEKKGSYDYSGYKNKCPDLKAADWVLPYFQRTEWRVIDELIYVPHNKCYDEAFARQWDNCIFVFDEDDDDHRWERVEFYYPNDPYILRKVTSYEAKGAGNSVPMNVHAQSDSLGDRGEFDVDNSGRGKLYISKWDGRLHLYGAEWGSWLLDSKAKYNGSKALPNICSNELAKELETVVMYHDTDDNGFFDLVEFDYDGDRIAELTVSLTDYGTDVCELIDPAVVKWQGLHDAFKQNAKAIWQQSYELYRVFWRKGLSNKTIDDLAFASSTWDKYFTGTKLREAIFAELYSKLKGDTENLKLLTKYYFTGDFTAMKQWMLTLDFNKKAFSAYNFTLQNSLAIERNDELVSIPLSKLKGLNIESFVVLQNGNALPSQTDDGDFDGIADSIVFLADFKPNETIGVVIDNTDKPASFPKRTHAEISIAANKPEAVGTGIFKDEGKFKSKKYLFRKQGNKSVFYRYEGPLIESDKVAYRLYWDNRGALDIFGKTSDAFVGDAHRSSASHHTMQSWGRDLLHNGTAMGVGGLAIGTGDNRFSPAKARDAKIIIGTDGPIKSSYRMIYNGFDYQGKNYNLVWDISMSAGQRYLTHKVSVISGGSLEMMAALTNHADEHKVSELHNLSEDSTINYFAGYGEQVFADEDIAKNAANGELMGMALLWHRSDVKAPQQTALEYRAIFKPTVNVSYYSLAAYNKEFGGKAIGNVQQFKGYLSETSLKLSNPILVR